MRFLNLSALLAMGIAVSATPSLAQNSQTANPQSTNPHQLSQAAQRTPPAHQRGDFDRGIYLGAAGNVCGSIVSYNFSPGDNPQLESITTCTPAARVTSKRALGRQPQPRTRRVFVMGVAQRERR